MDYRNLFKERNVFTSDSFSCSYFQQAGEAHLIRDDNYPMLFVLEGGMILSCEGAGEQALLCGNMVIVDRKRISKVSCQDETVLMEYASFKGLTARIRQHPTCFAQPCLPVVPITGRLETWVEQQFQPCPGSRRMQDDRLLALLVKYQSRRLKIICKIMKEYLVQKETCRKRKIDNNNLQKREYELPELI